MDPGTVVVARRERSVEVPERWRGRAGCGLPAQDLDRLSTVRCGRRLGLPADVAREGPGPVPSPPPRVRVPQGAARDRRGAATVGPRPLSASNAVEVSGEGRRRVSRAGAHGSAGAGRLRAAAGDPGSCARVRLAPRPPWPAGPPRGRPGVLPPPPPRSRPEGRRSGAGRARGVAPARPPLLRPASFPVRPAPPPFFRRPFPFRGPAPPPPRGSPVPAPAREARGGGCRSPGARGGVGPHRGKTDGNLNSRHPPSSWS